MKIYANTTIQYLTAEAAGGDAGWYAVAGGMSPDQEGAVQSLNDMTETIADVPVILNAASQDVERPGVLNSVSVTYIVEDDFAPSQGYSFTGEQPASVYNSVQFSEGLSLTLATVTEYTQGADVDHTGLTLTFTGSLGQVIEMHFEHAESAFSFGFGDDSPVDLMSFVTNLPSAVATDFAMTGSDGFDSIEGDWRDNDIDGVSGRDTIKGYGGNDTITLQSGEAYGGEGNDTITTKSDGTKAGVSLYGGQGNDTLVGGDNNDTLDGGSGADTIDGGEGFDIAYYSSSRHGVNIDLEKGTATGGDATGDTLTNIEGAFGSAKNDTFAGDSKDNFFVGREGDDTFIASGGKDTYFGGNGDDDHVDYSAADSGISVSLHDYNTVKLTQGNGDENFLRGIEHVTGTQFDDEIGGTEGKYTTNHGNNTLKGLGGNDTLRGGAGNDTLEGGKGDDMLVGGAGADKLVGGEGFDTASYADSKKGVIVDLSNTANNRGDAAGDSYESIERLEGSKTADEITGSDASDILHGNGGSDQLYGKGGNDTLTIQAGRADGGEGNDTLTVENGTAGVSATLVGGAGNDTLKGGIENTVLEGGEGSDTMDGGAGHNTVSYASSDAGVYVNLTNGKSHGGDATGDSIKNVQSIVGSSQNDELRGSSEDNRISGGEGNDVLSGAGGSDDLMGGAGTDTVDYHYSKEGVKVDLSLQATNASGRGYQGSEAGGDAAGDILSGIENIKGSKHNDVLRGSDDVSWRGKTLTEGKNTLLGGKGDDVLEGKGGADKLIGGKGSDTASYESSDAGVNVNLKSGKATGGDATGDTLINIENLSGSQWNDILVGDEGDNKLSGKFGSDRLKGGEGQDTLDGGYGSDVLISKNDGNILIGGAGNDVFDLSRVEDLSDIATDIIKDFQHGIDSIKLSEAHMGDDNVVTAVETTMNGVSGLALTTNVGSSTVNFAFLEGVSDISASDFDGDYIPTIDVV